MNEECTLDKIANELAIQNELLAMLLADSISIPRFTLLNDEQQIEMLSEKANEILTKVNESIMAKKVVKLNAKTTVVKKEGRGTPIKPGGGGGTSKPGLLTEKILAKFQNKTVKVSGL